MDPQHGTKRTVASSSIIRSMPIDGRELKQNALVGLRHERQRMDELVARLERELGTDNSAVSAVKPRRKRRLSAAGRANIVAALKKRWAAIRKAKTEAKPKARKATKVTHPKGTRPGPKATLPSRKQPSRKATVEPGAKTTAGKKGVAVAPAPVAQAIEATEAAVS